MLIISLYLSYIGHLININNVFKTNLRFMCCFDLKIYYYIFSIF